MKLVWTPEALQDRIEIWDRIAAENPQAAVRMDVRFSKVAAKIVEFPRLGRPGKVEGTREVLPHESYRLVYEIDGEVIWVLALVHASRRWPPVRQ